MGFHGAELLRGRHSGELRNEHRRTVYIDTDTYGHILGLDGEQGTAEQSAAVGKGSRGGHKEKAAIPDEGAGQR